MNRMLATALIILIVQLAPDPRAAEFEPELASRWIREQCELGPRVPGTPAHEQGRKWIGDRLRELGLAVQEQEFTTSLPLTRGRPVRACNIWGLPSKDGPTSPALIISAHWDTRPFGDNDPSGTNPPMLGANDGAAGVAMALGLYKALSDSPLKKHVVLAFWDAEDAGISGPDTEWTWAVGARYAAAHRPPWIKRVKLGINIDMPAGSDLNLKREFHSEKSAPWAVDEIWRIGHDLAPNRFSDETLTTTDDHLPWVRVGVPFVDLIGWPYEYWHTAGDAPMHCDPKAMRQLAEVLDFYIRNGNWKKSRTVD